MSDVIEVSMTETDHAHGKEIMGQVCDQHGSDKNFPDQVPQPDRETLNRWLYCVLATGESGDDATSGEMSAAGLTTRRDQQHEIIRRSLIAAIVIEADRSTCPSSQCRHVDGTRFEGVSGSRTRYSTKDSAQTQNLLRAINSVALRA